MNIIEKIKELERQVEELKAEVKSLKKTGFMTAAEYVKQKYGGYSKEYVKRLGMYATRISRECNLEIGKEATPFGYSNTYTRFTLENAEAMLEDERLYVPWE